MRADVPGAGIHTGLRGSRDQRTDQQLAGGVTALQVMALAAAWLAIFLASHPYPGIWGDAQLYTLQTLAAMNPVPLAGDLFLRYGSQNNFTIFPLLVAPLVKMFGLEAAAASVTLLGILTLLIAGWFLAHTLSNARQAWLAVGLMIGIQGWYGAGNVFRFDELYLNARVPTEALSIFALALACKGRWWGAGLLAAASALIHPVMAAPTCGLIILLALDAIVPERLRPEAATALGVTGALFIALLVVLLASPATPDRELWINTLRSRTAFLFLDAWRTADWLRNALGPVTLLLAAILNRHEAAGRLAYFALLIVLLGLGLAWLPALSGRFDMLLLAQSWRWTWLGLFVGLAILPSTLATLWRQGGTGQATALLLAGGWALYEYSGGAMAIAAVSFWLLRARLHTRSSEVLRLAGYAAIASAGLILLLLGMQALPLALDDNTAPGWVQRTVNICGLTGPALLLIVPVWFIVFKSQSRIAIIGVLTVASVGLTGLIPYSIARSTGQSYSDRHQADFAPWRDAIPAATEVLWNDPVAVWALLNRRSFLSGSQSAGLVYSRQATDEFIRRAHAMSALASPGWWTLAAMGKKDEPKTLTQEILREICREPQLGYVVDRHDIGGSLLRAEWPSRAQFVFLYDCRDFRVSADT